MPTARFNKEKVNSFLDQIITAGKAPEKSVPGAPAYNNHQSWRYTQRKVIGGEKTSDDRTHWVDEKTHIANWTPGFKYPDVDVTKYKQNKICVSKIVNANLLAETNELTRQAALPSPASYKMSEAFDAANSPKGKWKTLTLTEKRVSFVDTIAKKSISPGPAKHSNSITSLNWLSKSPGSRSRL